MYAYINLGLDTEQLRKWLTIVHVHWRRACGWPRLSWTGTFSGSWWKAVWLLERAGLFFYSSLRLFLNAEAHCLICSFQAKRSAACAYWRWLILFAVFSSMSYYVAFIIIWFHYHITNNDITKRDIGHIMYGWRTRLDIVFVVIQT